MNQSLNLPSTQKGRSSANITTKRTTGDNSSSSSSKNNNYTLQPSTLHTQTPICATFTRESSRRQLQTTTSSPCSSTYSRTARRSRTMTLRTRLRAGAICRRSTGSVSRGCGRWIGGILRCVPALVIFPPLQKKTPIRSIDSSLET